MHFALLPESEPMSHDEASQSSHWRAAMEEELRSIEKNQTLEVVHLPQGKRPIDEKWVYKTKVKHNGDVSKYKAKLVARGFFCKNMAWITMRFSLQLQDLKLLSSLWQRLATKTGLSISTRCEVSIFEWAT